MQSASIETLADQLRMVDLRVTLAGQRKLMGNRALLGMVRGALGHALSLSASPQAMAGAPCVFDPPCAYDLFHNEQAQVAPGFALPKPFVLRADVAGPDLRITLRLFGGACDWAAEFRAGLIAGLRGGLDLGPVVQGRRTRLPLTVSHVDREAQRLPPLPACQTLTLCSVTPIIQRLQSDPEGFGIDPMALLNVFALWLCGVARWHGIELAAEGLFIPLPPGGCRYWVNAEPWRAARGHDRALPENCCSRPLPARCVNCLPLRRCCTSGPTPPSAQADAGWKQPTSPPEQGAPPWCAHRPASGEMLAGRTAPIRPHAGDVVGPRSLKSVGP